MRKAVTARRAEIGDVGPTCRVLHIVGNLRSGGITRLVTTLVALNGENTSRHDVLVAATKPDPSEPVPRGLENGELFRVDASKRFDLRSFRTIWNLFDQYDGLMLHATPPVVNLALVAKRRRCFVFQHGMSRGRGSKRSITLRRWMYSSLPLLIRAKIVCSTPFALEKVRGSGMKLRDGSVVIVPFGIPLTGARIKRSNLVVEGRITVGMAGRLVAQKRQELVIRSLADYHGRTPIVIRIAGDGPLRDKLEEQTESMPPNVHVEFLGDWENMAAFYDTIDLLVFPSRRESFGLVVPEALDRCVPVAVFPDVGGCRPLIRDGETGFVLEDAPKGLEDLWRRLDADPTILTSMSRRLTTEDLSKLAIEHTRRRLDALAGCEKVAAGRDE